jgi:xylulokinase
MYLGIDLGTSSVKVVLLNDEQEVIGQHSQSLTVSQPKPLWSEQDPEHWWQATREAMRQLKKQYSKSLSAVRAIGLSGQQHGATLLDKHQKVLRPAMLWNDGRAMAQCKTLSQVENSAVITGSTIMAGFTAPKVLWVAEHEPELFKQIDKVLLPKDYLRLRMTGDYATDLSDASGTSWLDIGKRDWSDAMLDATGLDQRHMPKLHEGTEITSTLTATIATEWGMRTDTVVVGGGGDNPAGAISMNVIKPGSAFLSLGTSGVYFVASHAYQPNAAGGIHTFCHCLPEQWHYMSVHLSAASCLSWLANTLQVASTKELLLEAEKDFSPISPVIFLPYLSGERTPHGNPHAKGIFFGMTHSTNRADLTRAVLEGVAFAFADGQDAMMHAGVVIDDVSVVGGGAKSLFWGQILAAALQRPLNYRVNREVGSALGAARLGYIAANNCDPQTAFAMPPIETVIEPDPELVNAYVKKQQVFRKLYYRLEDMFETI